MIKSNDKKIIDSRKVGMLTDSRKIKENILSVRDGMLKFKCLLYNFVFEKSIEIVCEIL